MASRVSAEAVAALRRAARDADALDGFLARLKSTLASSTDEGFRVLREHKLLTLGHDRGRLARLVDGLRSWCPTAPLPSATRRRVLRHLDICCEFQGAFSWIDERAGESAFWGCAKTAALLALLDAVELHWDRTNALSARISREDIEPEKSFELQAGIIRTHRDYCDAALLAARQTYIRCPAHGANEVDLEELDRVLHLAFLADLVLGAFDLYSYNGWQILRRGPQIRLVPTMGDSDRARHWAGLRIASADTSDRYSLRDSVSRFLKEHVTEAAFQAGRAGHPWLAGSRIWQQARGYASKEVRRAFRAVEELFDPDERIGAVTRHFTVRRYLAVWEFLVCLVLCERARRGAVIASGGAPCAPVWRHDALVRLAAAHLECDEVTAVALLDLVTSDAPSRDGKVDWFYAPLLRLESGDVALAMSYAETARFERNLFAIAAGNGSRRLSVRGFKPIAALADAMRKAGFSCVENVTVVEEGRALTDLDLGASAGTHLFLAQAKIAIEPDSPHDEWSVRQKLAQAAVQLSACLRASTAMFDALRRARLRTASSPRLVPFLLTNVWQFTGTRIGGFPVIDVSYLGMLLSGGIVSAIKEEGVYQARLIKGSVPTAAELCALIENPIHRKMFAPSPDGTESFAVGDRVLTLPVRRKTEVERLVLQGLGED